MFNKSSSRRNTYIASAVLAGIAGTISAFLTPKGRSFAKRLGSQTTNLASKFAEDAKNLTKPRSHITSKHLIWTGLLGGMIGVTTGFLIAPKSREELLTTLSKAYNGTSKKTLRFMEHKMPKISVNGKIPRKAKMAKHHHH